VACEEAILAVKLGPVVLETWQRTGELKCGVGGLNQAENERESRD
jgi:hypothetical protein